MMDAQIKIGGIVMQPLAQRPLLGFPGASVTLHVEDRDYAVTITDPMGSETWKPTTKAEAKDMYFHPFCFGYEYRNESTYEIVEEDGA